MKLVDDVRDKWRFVAPALVPAGLAAALAARKTFRARGLTGVSLANSYRAHILHLDLLPPGIDLGKALVVDIGANEGLFTQAVLAIAPGAKVIAVEPAPDPRARLEQRFGRDPRVEVVGKAVGAENGTATLHLTEHDHNSSLRQPLEETGELYGLEHGWSVVGGIDVEVTTLDTVVGDRVADVVKIDVQGAEVDVLKGAERTLERARAVLLEVTFLSHYEGDATFVALNAEMESRGFRLANLSLPIAGPDGTALWADACYARAEAVQPPSETTNTRLVQGDGSDASVTSGR